jgi:hypothetical protein
MSSWEKGAKQGVWGQSRGNLNQTDRIDFFKK